MLLWSDIVSWCVFTILCANIILGYPCICKPYMLHWLRKTLQPFSSRSLSLPSLCWNLLCENVWQKMFSFHLKCFDVVRFNVRCFPVNIFSIYFAAVLLFSFEIGRIYCDDEISLSLRSDHFHNWGQVSVFNFGFLLKWQNIFKFISYLCNDDIET